MYLGSMWGEPSIQYFANMNMHFKEHISITFICSLSLI